jgi:hypothetical protein
VVEVIAVVVNSFETLAAAEHCTQRVQGLAVAQELDQMSAFILVVNVLANAELRILFEIRVVVSYDFRAAHCCGKDEFAVDVLSFAHA